MHKHLMITDKFSKNAKELRKFFVSQFQNPRNAQNKRFVWDYWHVPDQYTLVRTPAYHYFPEKLYMKLHKELIQWGRTQLGCWDISPPWLSYYVEGCKQEMHSDVPHGPWAFVYSISPEDIKFQGGETLILKPEVLNYWGNFTKTQDRELNSFVDRIPSPYNRLTVFDPRFPHSVTEVRGVKDPLQARLVIHGWFTEPKTYIEGVLPAKKVEKTLNQAFEILNEALPNFPETQGTVSLQLAVGTSGAVKKIKFGTNTLIHLNGQEPYELNRFLIQLYKSLMFPAARAETKMTIPLVFN